MKTMGLLSTAIADPYFAKAPVNGRKRIPQQSKVRTKRFELLKLQKAVKDETVFVALGSLILSVLMVIVFFVLNKLYPEQVPAGLPVLAGAAGGCAVAAGNFFLMALTVQKVAGIGNYDEAYRAMQVSYRYRTFLQLIWCVLAMVLKFINPVAGILPLLWPSLLIKGRGITGGAGNPVPSKKGGSGQNEEDPGQGTDESSTITQ